MQNLLRTVCLFLPVRRHRPTSTVSTLINISHKDSSTFVFFFIILICNIWLFNVIWFVFIFLFITITYLVFIVCRYFGFRYFLRFRALCVFCICFVLRVKYNFQSHLLLSCETKPSCVKFNYSFKLGVCIALWIPLKEI